MKILSTIFHLVGIVASVVAGGTATTCPHVAMWAAISAAASNGFGVYLDKQSQDAQTKTTS